MAFEGESYLNENEIEHILKSGAERKCLDLSGHVINADHALLISDWIVSSHLFSFEHVNLNSCKIPQRGFDALVSCAVDFKELTTFSACANEFNREAGFAVSKLLGARGRLKRLNLSDNRFGDVGIASIAGTFTTDLSDLDGNSIVSMLSLTELDISGNCCGDMGVLALCRGLTQFSRHCAALGRFPSLKIIDLSRNNIGDKGSLCLAQLLASCTILPDTGTARATPRQRDGNTSAGVLRLERMVLDDNPIGARGLAAFFDMPVDVALVLSIKSLGLARCKVTIAVFDALISNLQTQTSSLECIDLALTEQGANQIMLEQLELTKDSNSHKWTTLFRKLSEAVAECQHHRPMSLQLGALPEVIRTHCLRAKEDGNMDRFYDLAGALDAMATMRVSLQLSPGFLASISTIWAGGNGNATSSRPTIETNLFSSPSSQIEPQTINSGSGNTESVRKLISSSSGQNAPVTLTPSQKMEKQQLEFSRLRHEHSVGQLHVFLLPSLLTVILF